VTSPPLGSCFCHTDQLPPHIPAWTVSTRVQQFTPSPQSAWCLCGTVSWSWLLCRLQNSPWVVECWPSIPPWLSSQGKTQKLITKREFPDSGMARQELWLWLQVHGIDGRRINRGLLRFWGIWFSSRNPSLADNGLGLLNLWGNSQAPLNLHQKIMGSKQVRFQEGQVHQNPSQMSQEQWDPSRKQNQDLPDWPGNFLHCLGKGTSLSLSSRKCCMQWTSDQCVLSAPCPLLQIKVCLEVAHFISTDL
jgi:hypothetical protein